MTFTVDGWLAGQPHCDGFCLPSLRKVFQALTPLTLQASHLASIQVISTCNESSYMRAAKDSPLLEGQTSMACADADRHVSFDTGADASDMSHVKALHSESVFWRW